MTYPLKAASTANFAASRLNMVNGQLLTNGIHVPELIKAYREIPRETLVDEALEGLVYIDEDIQIPGTDRYMLDPLVEARLLQMGLYGNLGGALVLGAASLPCIEIVAQFVRHAFIIEPDKKFVASANNRLGRPNVTIIETGYREGYARQAPYDLIVATGALASIPTAIATQLSIGGRLVAVVREKPNACGKITLMRRLSEDAFDTISGADASTPYLPGFAPETVFSF